MKLNMKNYLKYLDQLLEKEVLKGHIPGSCVLAGNTEEILYKKTYGTVQEDSIFCLCSMTKPITSAAALYLMDRGLIGADEPVSKYLPSFADVKVLRGEKLVSPKRQMKIKDLMNMTSGLIYPMDQLYGSDVSPKVWELLGDAVLNVRRRIEKGETISYSEACDQLAKAPLAFDPGTRWAYGMSADVLGGVVEAAVGMPYRNFLKQEILDPLGMTDTDFVVPLEKQGRVADVMSQVPGNPEIVKGRLGFPADGRALEETPYVTSTGGGWLPFFGRGLYSTLEDYGKFARMLLNGGTIAGKRYLSYQTVRELQKNHLTKEQSVSLWPELLDGYGYGNLMRVMMCPEELYSNGNVGEFGWDGLLGTYFFVDPEAGIYFVYMQQGPVDFTVRNKMRRIVYSSLNC